MLSDLNLARRYNAKSRGTNVISDFFAPALGESVSYDRLTFSFSSGALAAASRGIAGLVANNGKMRILAAPELSEADYQAILKASAESRTKIFEELATNAVEELEELANHIRRNYLSALSWMLRSKRLDLRFAFSIGSFGGKTEEEGIFHPKVGVLRDSEGNGVSFSGSINETLSGWTRNVEHFKVFKSWLPSDSEHFADDVETFSSYWYSPSENGIQFVDISDPLERTLVRNAPEEFPAKVLIEFEQRQAPIQSDVQMRDYQVQAVRAWADAGFRGILEMATGSGKTFTAANAVKTIRDTLGPVNVIVVAPNQSIASQWKSALKEFRPLLLTEEKDWATKFEQQINDVVLGIRPDFTIVSVINRSSGGKFLSELEALSANSKETLLIADEVHNFGAAKFRKALDARYTHRLGLSATPIRPFDEDGTNVILDFFGGTVFEFSIADALKWEPPPGQNPILCPFDYTPVWVELTEEELEKYRNLSLKVARSYHSSQGSQGTRRSGYGPATQRAEVLKLAANKVPALKKELEARMPVKQAIIYCQEGQQVLDVVEILRGLRLRYSVFDGARGATPEKSLGGLSERESILQAHSRGDLDVLIAMNMLDEGVDLPSARLAFLLASSGNRKEFVQRTGRVIRWSKTKSDAEIVDFLADPALNLESLPGADRRRFARLILKEIRRIVEYATPARNSLEVILPILDKEAVYAGYTLEEEDD